MIFCEKRDKRGEKPHSHECRRSFKMGLTAARSLIIIIIITSCRAPPLGAQLVADYFIAFSNLACRYEAEKKHIVYHYSRLSEEIRLKSESGRTDRIHKIERTETMDISIHTGVVIELSKFEDADITRQKIIHSNGIFSIFNDEIKVFFEQSLESNGIFTTYTHKQILATLLRRICRKNKAKKTPTLIEKKKPIFGIRPK